MENLIFVSAQPDLPYFHWQTKLYVHNFIKNGVDPKQIQILFSITQQNNEPSDGAVDLLKTGAKVSFYKDDRTKKNYIPSIKPYLISEWLKETPNNGSLFFLHDSDIIFNNLPNFKNLLSDDVIYLSDTKNYIGYDYLKKTSKKYEKAFTNCEEEQLIDEMCNVIPINKNVVFENQNNSGGAQYIIKDTDHKFWYKVYEDSIEIYRVMMMFQRKFPLREGKVQFWTAEMWSLLWNLWKSNKKTKISDELSFSWATDNLKTFNEKSILHMAGVTEDMKYSKFYKGQFIDIDPIELLKQNNNYFDYVDKNSATIKYVDNIKSYIKK